MRQALTILIATALPAAAEVPQGPKNVPEFAPLFKNQTRAPELPASDIPETRVVAGGLDHPWGLAILPEGGYLVTERPGTLRHVAPDGTVSAPIGGVPDVHAVRQGGLLDIALSPGFATDRTLYLTYSKPVPGGSVTAAARATLSADMTALTGVEDIFVQTPASPTAMHYGSRITPDGDHIWITTGEHSSARERVFAQDLDKTYGKVIRLARDGGVPADNPFAGTSGAQPEIWSLGHRNIQGDALDAEGRYWTLEHGPKGGDELNRPEAGRNYGWPVISWGENYNGSPIGAGIPAAEGMEQPVYYWDPVIAPGDMIFYSGAAFPGWQGDLLIGSLTPGGIVRLRLDGDRVTGEERLLANLGRVRDIDEDSDGSLLVLIDASNGALVRLVPEAVSD